jgi:DNA polymerase I-like protein with 3'-5' exonuclease and polymerase domains
VSPFAVQGNFNNLPRLEQIRVMLRHGMLLHPCVPPDAKGCIDAGKTPKWSVERRLKSPPEERFAAFQGPGSRDNVGLVPRAPNVLLDVDDHSDPNHHGLRVFEVRHPEFYGDTLRHPTGDGIHVQLHCEDVPEGQEKIEIPNYLGCVNVEIFVGDGENVIIPPSVHKNGTPYAFQGSQALTIKWAELLQTFNYEPSAGQESKAGRRWKADSDWKSKFRGNLLTLDIFALADHHGLLGSERRETQEGYRCYVCRCPWRDEHTKNKTDEWIDRDTSCVLLSASGCLPQFVCKHSHGDQYKLPEFLDWCETQTPGSVDAHCAQRWHDWSDKSKARRTDEDTESLRERGTDEPDGYFPAVDWAPKNNPAVATACPYPKDSILQDFYDYSAPLTEGADCFIIGSALAVVAGLLARNVHIPFGDDVIFPNIYSMIVGPPGDRKSHTIKISERMARRLLPHTSFLSKQSSAEAMFDEYTERPDKIHIIDDAAQLLATWISTQYGERASALFLQLYDCCPLDESFIRNRKQTAEKESRRYIEQTSTSVLYGATPLHAVFPQQKHQLGLSRRFLFYYSPVSGRFIPWPLETSIEPMVELFKPLLDLRGPIRLSPEAMELWIEFQKDNRQRKLEIPEERESEKYALSSEPVQVLKISTQFEACRAVKNGEPFITEIRDDTLECAIAHVGACLSSARTLIGLGKRPETRQQAEEILEKIRYSFAPDTVRPDTIYVSRSNLTRKFCHNTDRKGALQTDTLYLEIIPYLVESLEAKRAFKQGKREVYAFRAGYSPRIKPQTSRTNSGGPDNDPPRENQGNPPNPANSSTPVTQTSKTADFNENEGFCAQQDLGLEISASSPDISYNHYNYKSNAHKCARDGDLELFDENEGFCEQKGGIEEFEENKGFDQVSEETPLSEAGKIAGNTTGNAESYVPGRSFETPEFVFSADFEHAKDRIRELNANPATLISLDLETCKATGAHENTPLSRARAREGFWTGKEALYPHLGEIRLLTVCVPGSRTVVFDLRRLGTDTLPWRSLFESRETIVHNGMFECKWLRAKLGFRLPKVFDTMHAAHTLQNGIDGQRNHLGLATIVKRYLGRTVSKVEQLSDFGVDALSYEQITYAAGDVDLLDLLRQELRRLMDSAEGGSLLPVFELDMRYLPILAEREGHGTRFDVSFGRALVTDATNTVARVERRLSELLGAEVLLSSPAQVKKALELLVGREITDTSADTLKTLSADCEAARLMLEHRKAAAILTQTGGLLDFVHDDGRIYPSFNMGGTETGRILSTNPTLNNLSVDTGVRSCILPDQPGYVVVKNDFSREEPTIAAVEFGVKNLIEDILNGRDLYRGFTTAIFGVDYESVRPEQLAVGKANFLGVTYGEKVAGLIAAAAKEGRLLTEETARQIIDGFDLRYPELRDAWNQAQRAARKGLIRFGKSKLGRRRLLLRYREQPTQDFLNSGLRKAKVAFFGSVPAATKTEKLAHTDFPPEGKSAGAKAKNAARREAILSARVKWAQWERDVLPGVMEQIAEAWNRKETWRESWAAQQLQINFRIQAGGSDVIRLSEILVDARLPEGCRTLLSNHDEIVVSCPKEKAAEVTKILQESMHEAFSSLYPGIPIKSEPEVGETWK